MTATKTRPFPAPVPAGPSIDRGEAFWAAQELAALIDTLGGDSPVAMVLRHARREIASLTTAPATAGRVVGPFRIAA